MSGHGPHQADRLLALPIRGESFLLQRKAHTILVDGGYKSDRVAPVLRSLPTPIERLDVVVCTHGDRDHAGGLAPLLGDTGVRVGQLWLPGRWADVVPDLIRDPKGFVDGLVTELDRAADGAFGQTIRTQDQEGFEATALAHISEQRSRAFPVQGRVDQPDAPDDGEEEPRFDADDDEAIDLEATEAGPEPDWFASLRNEVGRLAEDDQAPAAFQSGRQRVRYRRRRRSIGKAAAQFWLELIDTAEAIRGIAKQAILRGIRVRWFDFHEFTRTRQPRGGIRNFLLPLNAVEQAPPPQLEMSYVARLTQINEECLAFFAPPSLRRLGIVFCGDSPLGDGRRYANSFLTAAKRPLLPVVATAPHHGSESNACAYQHLGAWANVWAWLRAGGSAEQPGSTFQALRWPQRLCSKCPRSGKSPILAGVSAAPAFPWSCPLVVFGHVCGCQ